MCCCRSRATIRRPVAYSWRPMSTLVAAGPCTPMESTCGCRQRLRLHVSQQTTVCITFWNFDLLHIFTSFLNIYLHTYLIVASEAKNIWSNVVLRCMSNFIPIYANWQSSQDKLVNLVYAYVLGIQSVNHYTTAPVNNDQKLKSFSPVVLSVLWITCRTEPEPSLCSVCE